MGNIFFCVIMRHPQSSLTHWLVTLSLTACYCCNIKCLTFESELYSLSFEFSLNSRTCFAWHEIENRTTEPAEGRSDFTLPSLHAAQVSNIVRLGASPCLLLQRARFYTYEGGWVMKVLVLPPYFLPKEYSKL